MKILHVTAHIGGGVGKALSGLVDQASASGSEVEHRFVCLEKPEKTQFLDQIRGYGCEVVVRPSMDRLEQLLEDADLVQLEWWNHPATIEYLCNLPNIPIRLLTWCHSSGLYNPIIPQQLISSSHRFLFTSPCSFESKEIMSLVPELGDRLGVVSSGGGLAGLPETQANAKESIYAGYIGSLNFAKLHPHYIDYLAAVELPGFRVRMIGDVINQDILNQQCDHFGKKGMLEFRGYSRNIISELSGVNVLIYLLNPEHYGTAENALLEAMAMGIVPIVLNNPAERHIVDDNKTGLIVRSPIEFREVIQWLSNNPDERRRLGREASQSVREKYSLEKMESALNVHYQKILSMGKRVIKFKNIFGADPAEWFLSCQRDRNIFASDGSIHLRDEKPLSYGLFEKTKGTAFHFSNYFQGDLKLKRWAKNLTA